MCAERRGPADGAAGHGRAAYPTGERPDAPARSALEVLGVALRLGLTSFGGPVAHLGYFRAEYVQRRRWLDEEEYAALVGLCQFLPGPASSELGIAIGVTRAGVWGGLAAWAGFTLPSAVALTLFGLLVRRGGVLSAGPLHGLQIVAVAVVAQAVWNMARTLAPDRPRATLALLSAIVALAWPAPATQVLVIGGAGLLGWRMLPSGALSANSGLRRGISRRVGLVCWALVFGLLLGLPLLRHTFHSQSLALADSFFRAGALVFGGGHVILPLLQTAVVPPGWVSNARFLAGYGAAQAVPGPLSTFAAYLGAVEGQWPNGVICALLCLLAIYVPAFLFVIGALPFWETLHGRPAIQSALRGVNAAVVGLLLAAFYNPVWVSAIKTPVDVALGLAAFGLLAVWRLPPWLVVLFSALGGALIAA